MKKLINNLILIGTLLWGALLPAQQVVLLALDAPSNTGIYTAESTGRAWKTFGSTICPGYDKKIEVSKTATATATSTISKADAQNKADALARQRAIDKLEAEGQDTANSLIDCSGPEGGVNLECQGGNCPIGSAKVRLTRIYTKQCPAGKTGSQVSYTTYEYKASAGGAFIHTQAQADAEALRKATEYAERELSLNGQNYANEHGSCIGGGGGGNNSYTATEPFTYSATFSKNGCTLSYNSFGAPAGIPSKYTYSYTATATRTSSISYDDAKQKAIAAAREEAIRMVNTNGQAQANANGICANYGTSDIWGYCGQYRKRDSDYKEDVYSSYTTGYQCFRRGEELKIWWDTPQGGKTYSGTYKMRFYPSNPNLPSYGFAGRYADGYGEADNQPINIYFRGFYDKATGKDVGTFKTNIYNESIDGILDINNNKIMRDITNEAFSPWPPNGVTFPSGIYQGPGWRY